MKKIISVLLVTVLFLSFCLPAFAQPFSDIGGHWAEPEINKAYQKGIVSGDGNGLFRPNDSITRAEFFKMLIASVAKPEAELFEKIKAETDGAELSHWFAPYFLYSLYSKMFYADTVNPIQTADGPVYPGIVELAYASGGNYPGMTEAANADYRIERWEMAFLMLYILENITDNPAAALAITNEQANAYPEATRDAVLFCLYNGILKGDENGNLKLNSCGTRAEATALLNRLAEFVDMRSAAIEKEAEAAANIRVKTYSEEEIPKEHVKVLFTMQNGKTFTAELYPEYAPQTVANFVALAQAGFYDGLTFHRILEGFVAQGGCPKGDGTGDAAHHVFGEFSANGWNDNQLLHSEGTLSMARGQLFNSASCQFFICYAENTQLDGNYAAFGKIIKGMDTVKAFTQIECTQNASGELSSPTKPIVIKSVKVIK